MVIVLCIKYTLWENTVSLNSVGHEIIDYSLTNRKLVSLPLRVLIGR